MHKTHSYQSFLLSVNYQDGLKEIDHLAEFLGVRADEQLKRNIVDMCSFDNMKTEKMAAVQKAAEKPLMVTSLFKEGYEFFRKGK